MATLNEIAYNIRNVASGGVASDDTDVSLRQIKFMVHYHRANLLLKYTDNGKKASSILFQVDELKPKASGAILKPFVGFNGDRALRSIAYKDDSSVDASFDILPIVQHHDRSFVNESRFIKLSGKKITTISDGKIFVWEGDSIVSDGVLEINAIFSNPTEVSSYLGDDSPYPISEELIAVLLENVLKTEFNVLSATNPNGPNNQADEKQAPRKQK
tara:strand:+ start:13953 stop:14597 length:645 start_codon:yes stop_codon:yes gene_type:complete